MIVVDTSIWIDFFRKGNGQLSQLLEANLVQHHPFITGELVMGRFPSPSAQAEVTVMLGTLPQISVSSADEFYAFVALHKLGGTGLGFVDAHLLSGVYKQPHTRLWSQDARMSEHAESMAIRFNA